MQILWHPNRIIGSRDPMIYGHFIEHFHRQIYDGVYDPGNPLSDEAGLRTDVLEAMRAIKVPILRWPGGCFVSTYHWKDAVGEHREPMFDKAWRVEDPNTFGTDEYIDLCRKVGCAPYICTNAGSGTEEEMSDWVEYCNLEHEGKYAKWRIANGHTEPHKVKYWSIGNENYGDWELGAKGAEEWGRLVCESAKMIKHVDPTIELTAAALTDVDWNLQILKRAASRLDWLSIHQYWDPIHQTNDYANYEQCMAYTARIEEDVKRVRGLLMALGLDKKIRIAFDEWNLRGWYHPNAHTVQQGLTKADYLYPRDKNDDNTKYTMADAVFTACFLHMCNRNCDIVGMANFAPIVNTRGCIFTHPEGIVLRTTYHVFQMFVDYLGEEILDLCLPDMPYLTLTAKTGETVQVEALDVLGTYCREEDMLALSVINKAADQSYDIILTPEVEQGWKEYRMITLQGDSTESYNDIGHTGAAPEIGAWTTLPADGKLSVPPHSVNVIQLKK